MKVLIINNLVSGLKDGGVFDFVRALAKDGDEIVVRSTDGTTDLRAFLYDAEEFNLIVASGGDGTVATVAYLLADTGIPMIPFPAGTANLLSVNLESPAEPHALAEVAKKYNIMDFDLGEIEFADGEKAGFTLMAGAGYDAVIMKEAKEAKRILGEFAYFTSALTNANPQFSRFDLVLDGEHIETSGIAVLLINFSRIQFDIPVVHENNPRDGVLDIVIFNTKDAFGLLPALLSAILDVSGDFPGRSDAFQIFRAKEAEIHADPPLPIQYDGETTDKMTPFKVKVLPSASRFVVSETCMANYS